MALHELSQKELEKRIKEARESSHSVTKISDDSGLYLVVRGSHPHVVNQGDFGRPVIPPSKCIVSPVSVGDNAMSVTHDQRRNQ